MKKGEERRKENTQMNRNESATESSYLVPSVSVHVSEVLTHCKHNVVGLVGLGLDERQVGEELRLLSTKQTNKQEEC
jgi:hypothetical protein